MVDQMYRRKGGARSMMRPSMELLEEAAPKDSGIAHAYQASFIL